MIETEKDNSGIQQGAGRNGLSSLPLNPHLFTHNLHKRGVSCIWAIPWPSHWCSPRLGNERDSSMEQGSMKSGKAQEGLGASGQGQGAADRCPLLPAAYLVQAMRAADKCFKGFWDCLLKVGDRWPTTHRAWTTRQTSRPCAHKCPL